MTGALFIIMHTFGENTERGRTGLTEKRRNIFRDFYRVKSDRKWEDTV